MEHRLRALEAALALVRKAGRVVFTTIHKFFPEEKGDRHRSLSGRRDIVLIADEAHRSQYDFIDGYARHMRDALPHASSIGDYISVYDIQRAVQDGTTVPIYYESWLAMLALDESARPSWETTRCARSPGSWSRRSART